MSIYYNPTRTRNIYKPDTTKPFKLSRSKIDLFLECPRCFYIDRRLGTGRPPGYPFNLNTAVDTLLKNEFDTLRKAGKRHPLQEEFGIEARPAEHEKLDEWRENFKGVQYLHEPTNFIITGAIDDLWINDKDEYVVVDYKSTSKDGKITNMNKPWYSGYKRQMEVYQWLLRKNGLTVSDTGYFVYANGLTGNRHFDAKIEFDITIIPYTGDTDWIDFTVHTMKEVLDNNEIPTAHPECDFCAYSDKIKSIT